MLVVIGMMAPALAYAVSGYAVSTMNGTGSLQYYGITEGEIWRHDIEDDVVTGHTKLVDGNASRPAINPSGTKVAFVRGDGKICLVGIDGGAVTELADGVANSMIDFPHDNWVYFTMGSYHDHDSRILKRVATDGSGVEAVEEFGWRIAQIQIANDLSRAVMRVGDSDGSETGTIIAYDMTDGSYHDVGGGSTWSCGSGFFADGQHLMDGHQDPHEEMDIRSWDGSLVKTYHNSDAVSWPPNSGAAEPSSWNHSIFHTGASTNSADWLCEAMGGSRNYASDEQVLINWRDERCIVTTADLTGPTDHGDFRVGSIGGGAQVSIEDNVDDEGQASFKITTPSATYFYQKEGMGFSSILDNDGNDWISYQPGGGADGEYRGIPNMGWEFHPGYTNGGSSWIESQSSTRVVIGSKSSDGKWECRWTFYATYAQMTLTKHDGSYWFLYEGTPGGGPRIDASSDWWMMSDGTKRTCENNQNGDIPGPEWICFGDAGLDRVLLLCHHEDDNHPDKFYQMENKMTVFGFGRSGMTTYMDYAPATFSIALYESTDHGAIAGFAGEIMGGTTPEPARFESVAVTPSAGIVATGGTLQFEAEARDQHGQPLASQPSFTWSVSDGQDIGGSGLFTAENTEGGPYTVRASATVDGQTREGTATVTVRDAWTDDFEDGTADGWTVGEGSWTVDGGVYTNTATASRGSYSSWTGSADWTDLTYTVDVTPVSSSKDAWVIFRVRDERNFYLYQLSGNDLYKQEGGDFTKIKDGSGLSYATDQTYSIKVVLEGGSIKVYSDEQLVIDHTDATFDVGYVGAGGYQSTIAIDNVMVSSGASSTAPRSALHRGLDVGATARMAVHAGAVVVSAPAGTRVLVTDALGREVFRTRSTGTTAIDTRSWNRGVYIVQVEQAGRSRVARTFVLR
jgi:hypothetical protein